MAVSRFFACTALATVLLSAAPAWAQVADCYPATADAPLESTLIIDGGGGSYWENFEKLVVEPFEKACGVDVTITLTPKRTFSQLQAYVARNALPWDISFTNSPFEFGTGVKEGLFEPLPEGFWEPLKPGLVEGSYNEYGTWLSSYSNIVVYNTKLFSEAPKDWKDFWDVEKFPGSRSLQDAPISVVMALLAGGVPRDEVYPIDDEKLKLAFAKLDELRPHIKAFWTAGDQPVQGTHRGDFALASAYSGRAVSGLQNSYDIAISWGDNVFNEVWLFRGKGAQHPRAAAALLAYFNKPEVQAEMAKVTGYSGGAQGMKELLPPETYGLLSTSDEHLALSSKVDAAWWRDNGARVASLWQEWVATGKVSLGQ